jgi:hypothetical protein
MGALIGIAAGALLLTVVFRGNAVTNTNTDNTGPELRYFEPEEFGPWWDKMSQELLRKLDAFRHEWGSPVRISPADGGIGRHQGSEGASQHNIDRWGQVRAVDVFPMVPAGGAGYRYMKTAADRRRAYEIAQRVGFTGIGLYTDTAPGDMLHVDVRPGPTVATWSRVSGDYLGIGQVV